MAKKSNEFIISDLSGGINDSDPPNSIPDDQCLEAENVEFFLSNLGERRLGAVPIDLTGSNLDSMTRITWLYRHFPVSDETQAQLWGFGTIPGVATQFAYKDTAWHQIVPGDTVNANTPYPFRIRGKTFQGKLFLAYKSAVDRLHVYDGSTIRRVGLIEAGAAPTGANSTAGTLEAVPRYYRIRYTVESGGVVLLRSEPSAVLTFTPDGSHSWVVITRPPLINEGETHWELELSMDNTLFYVLIASIPIANTTATDVGSTGLRAPDEDVYDLSEDSGDYIPPTSARFISVDEDRLIFAGSFEDELLNSHVFWTPVHGDPGTGNDERIPLDTDNFLDLNTSDGGAITDMSDAVNGTLYVFKARHIYKLLRTGQRTAAYEAIPITKQLGALSNSLIEAFDQTGQPCLYFLDPEIGPCRIGTNGVQTCGSDIQNLWNTVNLDATDIICTGVYYPVKKQIHWWFASGSSNVPNTHIIFQTDRSRYSIDGVRRGWTTATGPSAMANAAVMFAENVDDGTDRNLYLKPLVGVGTEGIISTTGILQYDTGNTDGVITETYRAHVLTKPYILGGLLTKFGVLAAATLSAVASGISFLLGAIRDYGVETTTPIEVDLTPVASETAIITPLDDFKLSELRALQLQYGDLDDDADPVGQWQINQISLKLRDEEGA